MNKISRIKYEREGKRPRCFVKVLFFLFFFVTVFFTVNSSVYAATLRWAQIDKGVVSHAFRGGAMVVQKDKITAINQTYGTSMFDGTKWNDAGNPNPRGDMLGDMFLDSRGILYVGGNKTDDSKSYIFESTDGLNFTPVQQFVDATSTGKIWNFTEDKYGNVWAGEYTTHTLTTGGHLWRRRPNGTWTNVANWAPPEDHIHQVYYDPYRDALYVAIGDQDHGILKLPSNKINADGISASDFSFILPTFSDATPVEVTAITSDVNYIYVGMDMHSPYGTKTRAIARITDDNVTQTINVVYPLAGCAVWGWADVDDAGNIIFSSTGINEWSCTNNYVNQIVVSSDHGTTWTVVKDFGGSATSKGAEYTGLASHYATNWSGLYGYGDGWGGVVKTTIGRVIPTNTTFYVDGTNGGVDWTNFGITSARPIKTLNYLELLDVQPGDTVSFAGTNTYSSPLIAGWSGNGTSNISLRGNTTSIFSGGNLANAPAVAETFESATSSWNFILSEAGGSITADTSIFHEGVQSAKVVRGASGITALTLKNVVSTNINEGETMYVSYWFYYPTDQTSGSDQNMLRILDNSSYELRTLLVPSSTSRYPNEIVLDAPQNSNWAIPSRKSITSGSWHKMYIEDYLHSTSGSFKMYIDNQLWLNVNGIKTITAGGKLNAIYFYPYQNPITFYIDDFKFGKLSFDNRGALNTNDYNFLDIGDFKFGGNNGALISSSSYNINLHDSIFNGLTNDAIISSGSASLNYYYNTIFGSGRYGFNAASSATLKNNVVYNSTTSDVFVGTGATLTGSNNWFKNSGKGGTGTYTDTGSTTWSGADPAFVNSGTGDFHLLSTSPLINAGAAITGFISDFVGTSRPQGSAPDIGAYEFLLPSSPSSLAQYKSDGITTITSGSFTGGPIVTLKFGMSSTNTSDSLTPQAEVRENGTAFSSAVTNSGGAVSYSGSPVTGTVTVTGLTMAGTTYHWQARTSNSAGQGVWVAMGGNPDFQVDTTFGGQAGVGGAIWVPASWPTVTVSSSNPISTPPPTPPAFPSIPVVLFMHNLSVGSHGNDVIRLQKFLIGYNAGASTKRLAHAGATGYFGSLTNSALAEFQKKVGIKPAIGFFGPLTRTYINKLLAQ